MARKALVVAALVLLSTGCISMQERQAQLWGLSSGPYIEDAKLGVFHAPLKKVFQAALDVLDDKNIPVSSQGPDYIKSGNFGAAAGLLTESMSINFNEDISMGTVTVKWRSYSVTIQGGVFTRPENEETPLGDTPQAKMQLAQEWYAALYKKLNP